MITCSVSSCKRKVFAKGYCSAHYARNYRHGSPVSGKPIRKSFSHGLISSPSYSVWHSMRTRCNNSNIRGYHRYGGRGIKVCERWDDFRKFLEDMGERPSSLHSIDRIDNNGNYEPANCYWATKKEQAFNRCDNKLTLEAAAEIRSLYAAGGITQKKLSEKFIIDESQISRIINNKAWYTS